MEVVNNLVISFPQAGEKWTNSSSNLAEDMMTRADPRGLSPVYVDVCRRSSVTPILVYMYKGTPFVYFSAENRSRFGDSLLYLPLNSL